MRNVRRLILVLAPFCLLARAGARAAEPANCTGTVVDENGVPIVSAQIKLEAASGQIVLAETDSAGRFTLRNLPSGGYTVEVRREGYFVLSDRALTLRPGSNEVAFTLNHSEEVHQQIQVTAPANQIDPEDTAQRSTLTARDILNAPVPNSHVLAQSLVALPEVTQDNLGNLHVAGARSGETQYMLDGFEINDPTNNTLTARFNIDATRAAEVQSSGFGAGYAHPGANILSLETPDGDDKWRFGTTNPAPGLNIQEGAHLGNWYPRFTFSGPLIRGRFWFSDSVSLQHTFAVVKGLPSSANTSEGWAGDNLLRFQFNFSPRHILHATFLYNRAHDDNLGLDALDPQSTTVTGKQERYFAALKDQIWLHDTLFDIGIAADSATLDYLPQGTQPLVLQVNGSSGNYFDQSHQRGRRFQAIGGVTAASRHWHGTHTISLGANVAGVSDSLVSLRGEIQALTALDTGGTACTSPSQPGCLVRQTTFSGPSAVDLSNTEAGAFAQDTWAISKYFVAQGGVRFDWDRFTQSAMAGPRAALNVLPFGDDRSKLSFSWGIYDAPLNLSLIGEALDQRQLDTFYNVAGVSLGPPVLSQFSLPASGLQQPRFVTSSASWQQKFAHNSLLTLNLLARNGQHGFAYVNQLPSQPGGTFLLEDTRKDRYRAASLSLRHVFSDDMEFYGAYTRSLARSNEVLNPALGSVFYVAQQSGPVAWDAPNRLVSWGWAPTHIWAVQLTYFLEYRSGYPYSAYNLQQQLVGAPNSLRFPAYVSLNLGIEKKFGFRGYLWGVRAEAVNIIGRQNPDVVVADTAAPNFGTFEGGQGRAFTLRVRFIGRK